MKNFEKKRGGSQLNFLDEIIVDNFAGGGGASTGMELATGRPVAIAINHDHGGAGKSCDGMTRTATMEAI